MQPPVVGMDRPPQGMYPHVAEAVPQPLTQRRNAILDVASEAERPELDWPQPSHSSPADARPARYAETRPGRTLSRVSGGPAGAKGTATAPPRTKRRSRATSSPAGRPFGARAAVETVIVLVALIAAVVIIGGLLNSGGAKAPTSTGTTTAPYHVSAPPFSVRGHSLRGETP